MRKTIAIVLLKAYNAYSVFKAYVQKLRDNKDDDIFDNPYLIL